MAKYGPTFGDEVIAAGLGGLPFSWTGDEIFGRDKLTEAQNTTLDEVEADHDPEKQLPVPPTLQDLEQRIFELEVRTNLRER